jgi:hypothetical protein
MKMGYSGQDIEVRSDLTAGISDEELEAAASTTAHVAMTFPSAPTVSVVVLCCGNEYPSEKLEQHNLGARVRNTCDRGAVTVPANAQPRGPNYSVKNAETVAAAKDLRVRLFTLAPGQLILWHFTVQSPMSFSC